MLKTKIALALALLTTTTLAHAADLILVDKGKTTASIVVSPDAGKWEKQAGDDLQKYIAMMSGVKLPIAAAPAGEGPQILVGQVALKAQPKLQNDLDKIKKKNPTLRADAIVVRRDGNRVLLAGTNDQAHYYAASWLLQKWGCRWFMPTDFGEVVPTVSKLSVGDLNYLYAPPFETRNFWLSWYGDASGHAEFQARNMMNNLLVSAAHSNGISHWAADLIPPGKTAFNIPLAEEKTMDVVAAKVEPMFAKGEQISFSINDGVYASDSARDKEIQANLHDKYMNSALLTDNFMLLYNGVAERLLKKHPDSKSLIGFLAYTNVTIPPQRDIIAAKPLVALLAPIDIDPNHGMDDPNSPSRQEYRAMVYRWAQVMQGRVQIYDYDQGMLVWRDIPNPSIQAFRQDVKHYRDAKILGITTESRGATATTFFNMYLRAQLMWNPDANPDALLDDFYKKFYGPAAMPMKHYWNSIITAFNDSLVTEHEYMVFPAIYTPQLIAQLEKDLVEAEAKIKQMQEVDAIKDFDLNTVRNHKQYAERMAFTRLSFDIIQNYGEMTKLVASDADYKTAASFGDKALAAREKLTAMNPTLTTYKRIGENGVAWFPGEVEMYRALAKFTDGTKGTLIQKTPVEWAFHRDPHDSGLAGGWADKPADLSFWKANKNKYSLETRKDYPTTEWEMLRTDLYAQAQGVRHPDRQSFTGFMWYRTNLNLSAAGLKGATHLMFPGMFNEAWLYLNGKLVAHRPFPFMWWRSDYTFRWDVDLSDSLRPGENTVTVRLDNPHHFGGIFRRPFLYRATS